jgi:hypothetical protein
MQLVQDGGLARCIQPKHHNLKITAKINKSTQSPKQNKTK